MENIELTKEQMIELKKAKCRETSRLYRLNNKVKDNEYHKQYRTNNVDKIREFARSYVNNNKDKVREYHRLHNSIKYNNDVEYKVKLLEYNRQYRIKNLETIRDKPFQENRGRKQMLGLNDNLELYNLF